MALELGKATEEQRNRAAEIGLLMVGLGRKKSAIQTKKANFESACNDEIAAIQAEEAKLSSELYDISATMITEK